MSADRVRVAFTMRADDYADLKHLAAEDDETVAGYLRKAIASHRYLKDQARRGATILIQDRGLQAEVIFR